MVGSLSSYWNDIGNAIWIGLGGFLVAFLVSIIFSRLTKTIWVRFIGNLISLAIVIWTLKLILDSTGAAGILVIGATALTGALMLGSENIASDLVAGIRLFSSRPFKTGDLVSIAGQTGKVAGVALTSTTLQGNGKERIIIRNSDVLCGTIVNFSTQFMQCIEVQVSLPANQDLEKAIAAILKEIKDSSSESIEEAYKPGVVCGTLSLGNLNMTVYSYVKGTLNPKNEKTRLMLTTLQALNQNSILLGGR